MDFNHYYTNQELEQIINDWATKYSNLVRLAPIGQSYQNRPIWLITITNQKTGPDIEKPAVWIDANIHATEITGTTTILHIGHTLLEGYGKDENITRLMDNSAYYLVPRVNPDGAALALSNPPRYIRSGVRPYPWEQKDEGLHEQDIDGDGRILQMRIPDPNGDWKISSLDSRLMEKRTPEERGENFYRLLPEGLIEDFDGFVIKLARQPEGLDFNRNFPFEWRTEGEQEGSGPYPTSEPEIRALVDFIGKHPNINLAITYHTFSRAILRPYNTKSDDTMETNDLRVFKKIGEIGTKFTGYRCVSTFHDFKYHPKEVITGVFDDWIYAHLGIFAYTIEQWDLPDEAGIKDKKFIEWHKDHPHEEDLQILKWCDEHIGKEAYVDWYKFDHPQLGKVELGGWDFMYTWRNPPTNFLGSEVKRNTPLVLAMGNMLPQLSIKSLEVNSLGDGKYKINLVVENKGFLPTYTSEQGKNRKAVRPVRVELEIPEEVTLINGKLRQEIGHLEGRSNKLDVSAIWAFSPTDNRARVEWMFNASRDAEIKVNVLSDRAGALHLNIPLAQTP